MTPLVDTPLTSLRHLEAEVPSVKRTLESTWAVSEAEVRAAQALRYAVFRMELGADLPAAALASMLDADHFDAFCDHLLVWSWHPQEKADRQLVGTYRVLPPDAAKRLGGLYIDQEFDLAPLDPLRGRMIELGRACVHADWRSGGVILMLWNALGRYMVQHGFETMVGCCSMGVADGGAFASSLWYTLRSNRLAEPQWNVKPRIPLALRELDGDRASIPLRDMPPLIKGYLRGGAAVLGPPAYDASFHTADFPIMMRTAAMAPRYRAHFLHSI